jgi:chemotaxis protein CheZ
MHEPSLGILHDLGTGPMLTAQILEERMAVLRARYPAARTDAVADVVRTMLATMRGDLTAQEASLLSEVEALGRTIAAAKAEIAELKVTDINASHIPSATDELDAIVAHTASATDSILEVCEALDGIGELLGKEGASPACADASTRLQEATTRIYEACSFQDITGQRITKVVATLKAIETKVSMLVEAFGGRAQGATPVARTPDADLLNGPQLPANAMDQSDIDRLLASFD